MKQIKPGYTACHTFSRKLPIRDFENWNMLRDFFSNKIADAIITLHHCHLLFQSIDLESDDIELYQIKIQDIQDIQVFNKAESFSVELCKNKLCGIYRADNSTALSEFEVAEYVEMDLPLINTIKKIAANDAVTKLKTRTYIERNQNNQATFADMRYVQFVEAGNKMDKRDGEEESNEEGGNNAELTETILT